MKGKKIIIISIIINIVTIGIIYNFIKKEYLNNEKIIVKAMTEGEYEDNITSLNTAHEEYANYIEESKKKIASALTDMGVTTSDEENLETMAENIKSIARDTNYESVISPNFSLFEIPTEKKANIICVLVHTDSGNEFFIYNSDYRSGTVHYLQASGALVGRVVGNDNCTIKSIEDNKIVFNSYNNGLSNVEWEILYY